MIIQTAGMGNTITYIIAAAVVGYIFYSFITAKKRMNKPPSENVNVLTDENFDSTIKSGISLVDFWAAWCGPCKVVGPIVDEVADEIGDEANICKLNVDQNKLIAKKYGIQSIPTLIIFKDGNPVQKLVGVKPKHAMIKAIRSHL